jgi:putative Holliday junction resolvase
VSRAGRLLGVDYGSVRVGLAISDEERRIASALATYKREGREQDSSFFRELVREQSIGQVIVGLPVRFDGAEGPKAAEVRRFGQWLAATTGLEVIYCDERFTTVEAETYLLAAGLTAKRRKARRDRVAAQIMLQSYIDAGCPPNPQAIPLNDATEDVW